MMPTQESADGRFVQRHGLGRGAWLSAALLATLAGTPGPGLAAPAVAQAPPAAAAAAPPAPPALTVEVRRFRVEGNTLLPAAQIESRLEPFKGQATLQRLREAAAAVQDLYRMAGYGGVIAFLPEQRPQDGELLIRVAEGKLTRIDLSGNQQFSRANILASLPALREGQTPPVREIDAQIQIANESPAKALEVLLQPGELPGTIAAKLTVSEQPVQQWSARLDNSGNASTGRWRAALGWQHANVAGRDHVLNIELQTAPDAIKDVAVLSAAYRMPLYRQAMAVDVFAAISDVSAGTTATAAGDLQFSGRGHVAGVRGSAYLPRWGTVDHRAALSLETRDYRNNCRIEGLPEGACGPAGASVAVQPISLSWTAQRFGELQLGLHVSVHHNLALGGGNSAAAAFDAVRAGAVRRYTLLRSNAQLGLPLPGWGSLSLRASGQGSDQILVPGELFGLGGQHSVRAYAERELGGDSGLQGTVEFISDQQALGWLPGSEWRWVLFADAGWVSNLGGATCLPGQTRCSIAAVGAGLRLGSRSWQLRLDLGAALRDAINTERGHGRAHASLNVTF